MRPILTAILLMLSLSLCGCGTLGARINSSCGTEDADLYPATQYDAWIIKTGGGIWAYGDCDNGVGTIAGWTIVVPLHILDTPISVVSDTVFLPVDLIRKRQKEKMSNQSSDPT